MMLKIEHTPITELKQTIISGITTELGQPVSRQVRVYRRSTGLLLASVRSNSNGCYKIYLPLSDVYTIVSIDPHRRFNAVIQDNVVPK